MKKIFVTSDPHYFHKNIAGPKVSSWKSGYRDFDNEIQMSRHIVKVWNESVGEEDTLYCLGDWSFQGIDNIWNFRKQLRVKTIHFLIGNHDHHIEDNREIKIPEADRSRLYELEIPNDYTKEFSGFSYLNTRDLFTSVNHVIQFNVGTHTFFCSHYSHRVWPYNNKGVIHLYGHSHNSIPDLGKSMDVGIDSAYKILGEYRPFSIEEIIDIMNKREIVALDHHHI